MEGKVMENIKEYVLGLCKEVKAAQRTLASLNADKKNDALKRIASALTENAELIIEENKNCIQNAFDEVKNNGEIQNT
jgi:gamma-glutamyl phosphate reductase